MSANLKNHFTVSEYERMGETGIFPPDARVELIEGEIIEMSPIGSRHAACVELLAEQVRELVKGIFLVRTQNPIVLDDFSEPQPDVAVLKFRPDRYLNAHPRPSDILIVIEVAETTVHFDRHVKVPLYARAGIPEVVLFNLPEDRLECFLQPETGIYQVSRVFNRGEKFESASIPGLTLDIETILG